MHAPFAIQVVMQCNWKMIPKASTYDHVDMLGLLVSSSQVKEQAAYRIPTGVFLKSCFATVQDLSAIT